MHTGSHDNFIGFSVLLQSSGQFLNDGIASFCGEGRHVEGASDLLSAAPDVGLAVPFSTGSIPGSQPDQGRDFLAVEFSQFGQIPDEHGTGLRADPRSALDDAVFVFEIIFGVNLVPDELVDFEDLEIEGFDHFSDALFDLGMADRGHSIGLLCTQIIELSAASDQFGQFVSLRCGVRLGHGFDQLCELGQDLGIDGIGLGPLSHAPGKITHLAGIDYDHGHTGTEQLGREGAFIAAGGLQDNRGDGMAAEGLTQLPVSLGGVGQIEFEDLGAGGHTEGVLGDIDSDIDGLRHGTFPFLRMRTRRTSGPAVQTAVRAIPTGATRFPLRDGLGDLGTIELSSPAGVGSARCAPLGAGLRSARLALTGFPYETVANHVCQHTRDEGARRKKIWDKRKKD